MTHGVYMGNRRTLSRLQAVCKVILFGCVGWCLLPHPPTLDLPVHSRAQLAHALKTRRFCFDCKRGLFQDPSPLLDQATNTALFFLALHSMPWGHVFFPPAHDTACPTAGTRTNAIHTTALARTSAQAFARYGKHTCGSCRRLLGPLVGLAVALVRVADPPTQKRGGLVALSNPLPPSPPPPP